MGKMVMAIIALVIIDILFLVTGQLGMDSPTSIILGAIQDPASIKVSTFWDAMIGSAGLGALAVTVGVTIAALISATNVIVFLPMGLVFAGLIGDYLSIYNILNSHNPILATMVMVPVMMVFILVVIEWVRAKD